MDVSTLTPAQQASVERTYNGWMRDLPAKAAAPLAFVRIIANLLRETNERISALIEWRDGLNQRAETLATKVAALEAAREKRGTPNVSWAGTHEVNKRYFEGELCSRNGLWLCVAGETTTTPGTAPADWKLVVHRKLIPTKDNQ